MGLSSESMPEKPNQPAETSAEQLARDGYWPARAAQFLADGKYSKAVEICRKPLREGDEILSGRLIYATALYLAGQIETATEQYYRVLASDPDNMVALKYLGDIKAGDGDAPAAVNAYERILEIDPYCRGLKCELRKPGTETTHTITLKRGEESEAVPEGPAGIPFYTETIGDLYLRQGHPRLAAQVFSRLSAESDNPRLLEKLRAAQQKAKERES